jgi:hypothetical protein
MNVRGYRGKMVGYVSLELVSTTLQDRRELILNDREVLHPALADEGRDRLEP